MNTRPAHEADPSMTLSEQKVGYRPGGVVLVHDHGAAAIRFKHRRDSNALQSTLVDQAQHMAIVRQGRREDDPSQVI
ncbi:hypothetical protein D3C83_40260 [compost metagenome]